MNINQLTNLQIFLARKVSLHQIDLSNNRELEKLNISKNMLYNIDVTHNELLKSLNAKDCYLTSIDLSHNLQLEELFLGFQSRFPDTSTQFLNVIPSLDLSANLALKTLFVENIQLSDLDITHNSQLDYIVISHNPLTSFSIENNPVVRYLYCNNTELETLDLQNGHNDILRNMVATQNPNLTYIQVDDLVYTNNNAWKKDQGVTYATNCATQVINEYEAESVRIYPNPAHGTFNISYDDMIDKLAISSLSGQEIVRKENTGNTININQLKQGVYIVEIHIGKQIIRRKLLVE